MNWTPITHIRFTYAESFAPNVNEGQLRSMARHDESAPGWALLLGRKVHFEHLLQASSGTQENHGSVVSNVSTWQLQSGSFVYHAVNMGHVLATYFISFINDHTPEKGASM